MEDADSEAKQRTLHCQMPTTSPQPQLISIAGLEQRSATAKSCPPHSSEWTQRRWTTSHHSAVSG